MHTLISSSPGDSSIVSYEEEGSILIFPAGDDVVDELLLRESILDGENDKSDGFVIKEFSLIELIASESSQLRDSDSVRCEYRVFLDLS